MEKSMNPDRWQRFQALYLSAVELSPAERSRFLQGACVADPDMRQAVETFIAYENKMGTFLEQTAIEALLGVCGEPTVKDRENPRDLIGAVVADRYIVRQYIGSGGMCHVYRADHTLLGTPVAIKRLRKEFRDKPEYRDRFVEEARRALSLDHRNIAKLKDVVEAGEVFLVMEFI